MIKARGLKSWEPGDRGLQPNMLWRHRTPILGEKMGKSFAKVCSLNHFLTLIFSVGLLSLSPASGLAKGGGGIPAEKGTVVLTGSQEGAKSAGGPAEPRDGEVVAPLTAEVYHCNDGDTCRVKFADSIWLNVRLAAIDAPETSKARGSKAGQPWGEQAKVALNAKVAGKKIQVRQVDLDPFNRPVVILLDNDQDINLQMIQEGFAEVYRGKTKRLDKAVYLAAEEKAKQAKKGIWSQESYQSPKAFRQEKKH